MPKFERKKVLHYCHYYALFEAGAFKEKVPSKIIPKACRDGQCGGCKTYQNDDKGWGPNYPVPAIMYEWIFKDGEWVLTQFTYSYIPQVGYDGYDYVD